MPLATSTVLVSELWPDRYGVGRTKVYEYLKALNITPFKPEGDKRSHITLEQLAALDHYAKLLAESDTEAAQSYADSFTDAIITPPAYTSTNAFTAVENAEIPPVIATLAQAITQQFQPATPQPDPLAPQRQLKEAWREGWILSTRQVRDILGLASWSGGDRYGFAFEKAGKVGAQSGWRVTEID